MIPDAFGSVKYQFEEHGSGLETLTDSSVCPVQENKQQQTSKKHDLQVSSAVFFPYTVFQWELSL